jgi:pimeloyl-ACP methyl ester carboxylesterase
MLAGFVHDPDCLSPELAAEIVPLMAAPGFAEAVLAGAAAATPGKAARIECPTLLIWGDRDRILPVSQAQELAGSLPDARLEVLRDVGHCPMFETPAEFNALLAGFAAETAAPDRRGSENGRSPTR